MKKIFKICAVAFFFAVALVACKKDDVKNYFEGGTNPVLTANKTGNLPLTFVNKDAEAIKITWTNPNYKFTTGLSSQDVNYSIEIDTTGANFTNPKKQTVNVSKELTKSFTQGEFNDFLLNQLVLVPSIPHNVEIRVKASLANGAVPMLSNVLKFTITPYAIPPKVTPSVDLFIVGNATPGGWNNPVPVPAQKFTKLTSTTFELTVALTGGNSYLFLPVNGDWTNKFGCIGGNNSNNVNGDDFKSGGGDMLAPAANGNYKIQVDFQRGKFSATKL